MQYKNKDNWNKHTKYLFISGGVYSSLGKGLSVSSIGCLLKQFGLKVTCMKLDPYLNVDPGTMSPYQHGEVYVTKDGAETDLDLGHYERFLDIELEHNSSVTAGKIYKEIISGERQGKYSGKTIQVIPHVTDKIKKLIYQFSNITNADVIIVEIGGTVGDIESIPFIEAVRQIRYELPSNSTIFLHMVPLIEISTTKEIKTKPLQHSIKELRSLGIEPDILLIRSKNKINEYLRNKISSSCYINKLDIFSCVDLNSIYLLPEYLFNEKIHNRIAKKLKLNFKFNSLKPKLNEFLSLIKNNHKLTTNLKIAIVGKYIELKDAYLSIIESLKITSYYEKVALEIIWIDSSQNSKKIVNELKNVQGIIVPGGFDTRGVEGKLIAINYARVNKIPFLGICLGMQLACIEFARNELNLIDANSTEFNPKTKNNIIDLIVKDKVDLGGTLRLGNYQCSIISNSLALKIYKKSSILRRHRHRYEFNNKFKSLFEKKGFIFSGINFKNNLQEIIELKNHPYFIATQYHPEFNSTLYNPEPLFVGLINNAKKCLNFKKN